MTTVYDAMSSLLKGNNQTENDESWDGILLPRFIVVVVSM